MKKTYFTSIANTIIEGLINVFIITGLIISFFFILRQTGVFHIDAAWLAFFTLLFFVFVINVHFARIGMYSRVTLSEEGIYHRQVIIVQSMIKWSDVNEVKIVNELKSYHRTVEVPVILVIGMDDKGMEKAIKIDFRKSIYNRIIENMRLDRVKHTEKMDKYFDEMEESGL
ncbi:MAG: hypothetical protein JXN65_01745 [Clostridia bacterium]|nr:hypothetical protein [Clostridia bacterium]